MIDRDLAPPGERRSRRHGVARRDRRRVRASPRSGCRRGDTGLQLLENSIATGAGARRADPRARDRCRVRTSTPSSRSRTGCSAARRRARPASTSSRRSSAACVGAIVANLMFDLSGRQPLDARRARRAASGSASSSRRSACCSSSSAWCGRVGLRSRRFAVGGYIAAAYWFTSSTSFANPAVTIARTLTNTFAGIRPSRCRCSSSSRSGRAGRRRARALLAPDLAIRRRGRTRGGRTAMTPPMPEAGLDEITVELSTRVRRDVRTGDGRTLRPGIAPAARGARVGCTPTYRSSPSGSRAIACARWQKAKVAS